MVRRPLVGHSTGAILGFEVARPLETEGAGPVRLMLPPAGGAPSTFRDEFVHLREDAGILAEVRALNGTASSVLADALLRAHGFSAA